MDDIVTRLKLVREINGAMATAYGVQDGANSSGIVHSFSNCMIALSKYAWTYHKGTEWKNEHPVALLFISKLASLAGGTFTFYPEMGDKFFNAVNDAEWIYNHESCGSQKA